MVTGARGWVEKELQEVGQKGFPGDLRDSGSIPGLGKSPRGMALQYSCLENPMDRGARWAIVMGSHKVGHT